MKRSMGLVLAAGAVGFFVGRAFPRGSPSSDTVAKATPVSPTVMPTDCKATRAELASTRAQLSICMAVLSPPPEAEPNRKPVQVLAAAPTASASAPPRELAVPSAQARVLAMLAAAPSHHVQHVLVRHADGTVSGYPAEEWPVDRDGGQIIARESADGVGYYSVDAGPDEGPLALHDLAGPDGAITMGGLTLRFAKKADAGTR